MSLSSLMTEDAKRTLKIKVSADGANIVQEKDDSATAALKALEKYIPTEVLALYIPAISIAPSFQAVFGLDAAFPRLERYLGHTRAFWQWLLERWMGLANGPGVG